MLFNKTYRLITVLTATPAAVPTDLYSTLTVTTSNALNVLIMREAKMF